MADKKELFDWLGETSPESAAVIVPFLIDIVGPASVLDVGCGEGAWLAEFANHGVTDTLGVDNVDPELVGELEPAYRRVDLNHAFDPGRRFDLALCLEVGEHLHPGSAAGLVTTLVASAPIVAFSAAIPGQGGLGHINEQWPDWWRAQFEEHGYRQHDVLRGALWDDERVAFWYAQNLFLYAESGWNPPQTLTTFPERVVHPRLLARARQDPSLRSQLRRLPNALNQAVRNRRR